MKRHRFDPVSFMFGIAFLALAVVASITSYHVGVRWLTWAGAALLITAGLSMVIGSRESRRENDR